MDFFEVQKYIFYEKNFFEILTLIYINLYQFISICINIEIL